MTTIKKYGQLVNMPQMALTGLSENWLFKEMGDCHWHMLCENLGLKSNAILDEFGNRLYATFIRIRFESRNSLKDFAENDFLDIEGKVRRLGNNLYFGQIDVASSQKSIHCSLATTFSSRENNSNLKLTKGVPAGTQDDAITSVSDIPQFIRDHAKVRKSSVRNVTLGDISFDVTDDVLYETSYLINPYTDINGVGLLYFAAYPLINDYCELEFFRDKTPAGSHWALNSSTMMRDVFYFGNCNIDDTISYRVHSYDIVSKNRIALQSSLVREQDGTTIARLFTVKYFTQI